jgi:aspartate aminotransferase-like enzyme
VAEQLLLTPGPTPVPPEVREALGRPLLHHRTSEFQEILKEVSQGLKGIFRTQEEVFVLTSSGTGAMEAAVVNLLSHGDEAIVIRGGKFGERWGEICEAYGIETYPFDVPWGKPLDLIKLQEIFQRPTTRNYKAVFATLCETSTAVAYDIQGIRKAMGNSQALLVVDAISGLGSEDFAMDAWGVDATICGSQKGLMLPPGLSFIALSQRAWGALPQSRLPRYYFDLRLMKEAWAKTDTPFTPGINLIVGLAESLRKIKALGVENVIATHKSNAEFIRKKIQGLGLTLYADPACASNAVTAVNVPPGIHGKELINRVKAQGITLAGGQGKELTGKIFRIASMGAIGREDIERGLAALEQALKELGWKGK